MAHLSFKLTDEENDLLTALVQRGHGQSCSQILRDALIDYSERYMDVERLRRIALHARASYRARTSRARTSDRGKPKAKPTVASPTKHVPPLTLLAVMFAAESPES